MIFLYRCFECDREKATEMPCVLVSCIECMGAMTLIKVNNKDVGEGELIQ